MSYSRLASSCQKCPYQHTCQNKRMEAMAALVIPDMASGNSMTNIFADHVATINMGNETLLQPDFEELCKSLRRDFSVNAMGYHNKYRS